jgi:diguanylate cyclase (GGDEF)-like protein
MHADAGRTMMVEHSKWRPEQPRLSAQRFMTFMLLIGAISLFFALPELILGALGGKETLVGLGAMTLAAGLLALLAAVLARLGRARKGVYTWSVGVVVLMTFIPFVAAGLIGAVIGGASFGILVIALFDSPRGVKPLLPLFAVLVAVATAIESSASWPRFDASQGMVSIGTGVNVLTVVVSGALVGLLGETLLRAFEGTIAYASRLEQATAEDLRYMATHDTLTDLPNRLLLTDRFGQARARAQRFGQHLALLMIDLDHFKDVNDSLGHGAGDRLLQDVAKMLEGCVRECDTVVRMGGDEFVLLLSDLQQPENARIVAQRVMDALSRPFLIASRQLDVSASIGISTYPADGETIEVLMRNADIALYKVKEGGRRAYFAFVPELDATTHQRMELSADLQAGLDNREFVVHYQPLVDLESGRPSGVEALVRWQHPKRGLVGPMEFIGLAEENGTIIPIGTWVLETACRQVVTWQAAGYPVIPLAVNLSSRQVYHRDLLDTVKRVLGETGLAPSNLEIEVTESCIMQDVKTAEQVLGSLKGMGVRIMIDNFGSGYSSLQRLGTMPITGLKIDRFFIQHVVDDKTNAAIVMAIVAMAKHLHLEVVAEGVETGEQLEYLRSAKLQMTGTLRCDRVQGFFFSRPLPTTEAEALFVIRRNTDHSW